MSQPFIDAHHHIWRRDDLPWLTGPMQPRIFGPYEAVRRDYLIDEFVADAGPRLAKSVYVQANWAPDRAVDEVAWVQQVADAHGFPHAIVGYADLRDPSVADLLRAEQATAPLLRGVRQQLHWHENPLYRFADTPDLADDGDFRRGMAAVADAGLLFELQVFAPQMAGAARLARDFADVPFVLMHCGMPEDRSPDGLAQWRDGMQALANCPNVAVKLSGLGTFVHKVDRDLIAATAQETIGWFGAERCLWGSNFPIEKLWTDYATLLATWQDVLADLPVAAQRAIFHDTAQRLYCL